MCAGALVLGVPSLGVARVTTQGVTGCVRTLTAVALTVTLYAVGGCVRGSDRSRCRCDECTWEGSSDPVRLGACLRTSGPGRSCVTPGMAAHRRRDL